MSVYSVHEPPLRAAEALADPARFAFVRDGFYWWAFVLTPFWMLRHRLWLVAAIYLVVTLGLETAMHILGASAFAVALVGILISLLVGLEAGTLRRFTLGRRRWRNLGIVSGDDLEDAERRFFAAWVRDAPARSATPSAPMPPAAPSPTSRPPEASGVVGLFPEPGAQR
jgi:hypothetical protein